MPSVPLLTLPPGEDGTASRGPTPAAGPTSMATAWIAASHCKLGTMSCPPAIPRRYLRPSRATEGVRGGWPPDRGGAMAMNRI